MTILGGFCCCFADLCGPCQAADRECFRPISINLLSQAGSMDGTQKYLGKFWPTGWKCVFGELLYTKFDGKEIAKEVMCAC